MNLEDRSLKNILIFHRNSLLSIGMPLGKIFNRYERKKLTQYGILARAKYEPGRPLTLTPEAQEYLSTIPEGHRSNKRDTDV